MAISQFLEYVIETPVATPPLVEVGETVEIVFRVTSSETTTALVETEVLDGTNAFIQQRGKSMTLYAGIPQIINFSFIAEASPNPLPYPPYTSRNIRIRITDQYGPIERIFSNIFEISAGAPEAEAAAPTHSPAQPIVGQYVLITSLITVSHPGTYQVTINLWEGGLFGQSTNYQDWSVTQYVTFAAGSLSKYVSAGNVIRTWDGDNLTRSVEIVIYNAGIELFKDDWNGDRFSVIEPTIEITKPVADSPIRYDGEIQRVSTFITISHPGTYKVFIDIHEGGIAGPGRFLWGDASGSGQEIAFAGGVGKWVSVTGYARTFDGDNGTRDTWVRIFTTDGAELFRQSDTDIYNVVKYEPDFEMQDYYPQASPQYVPIDDTVRITSRLKAAYPGQYKLIFMLYEESVVGHGEELYPPIEVDWTFEADVWADIVFDHVCTLPEKVRESTGVDIHIDIYDAQGDKIWEDEYPRVFDIGLGATGVNFEMQDPYPIATPTVVEVGQTVQVVSRIRADVTGSYKFIFFLKEESLGGAGDDLYPPIEINANLAAGVYTDVIFTHLCTMPSIGEGTGVDIHIDIYSGNELLEEFQYGRVFDITVEEPPTTCTMDSDCPEGFECVDGVCVLKPPEETNKLLLAGLLGGAALLLMSGDKNKGKKP